MMEKFLTTLVMALMWFGGFTCGRLVYNTEHDKLITTYEAELPRNQNCVLVAVIEKVRGDL